jgi:hypothetical protein
MHPISATLYDFPAGLAWAIFAGSSLFFVLIVNIFIIVIEAIVLRKMRYGSWLACTGAAFLMNMVSSLAGYITGYLIFTLPNYLWFDQNIFMIALAYYPWALIGETVSSHTRVSAWYVIAFLLVSYLLTVALEFPLLFVLRREHPGKRVWRMVLVINFFSYLFLFAMYWLLRFYTFTRFG